MALVQMCNITIENNSEVSFYNVLCEEVINKHKWPGVAPCRVNFCTPRDKEGAVR